MMPDVPALPPKDSWAPNLARLLAGDNRSSSALPLLVNRASMFTYQPLDLNEMRLWGLFYERLRNPGEVLLAVIASWRIRTQGISQHDGLLINLDIEMFPSFFDAPEGLVPLPARHEKSRGGHEVVLVGADLKAEVFGFEHLFSAEWGQDGQGGLPFDYVERHATGAISVRTHGGPEPNEPEPATSQDGRVEQRVDADQLEHFIDHYRMGQPESNWLLEHEADDVIWMGRRLIGAGNGDTWIQGAILIRGVLDKPLLVGWMFCRLVADDLIDVEEFFIWPTYRGCGLGTALAGRTLLYASATHARWVRWIETIDDAVVNAEVPTRMPAWASDFEWIAPDETLGWGAARVTTEIEVAPLLTRLGNLHAPGGVHLLWTKGVVHISPHQASPQWGLVLETDVPQPPAVP